LKLNVNEIIYLAS